MTKPKPKNAKAPGKSRPKKKAVKASEAPRQIIGERALLDLAKYVDMCKDRASSAGGDAGQAIKDAQEKKGLDPVAFRMAHRLRRMGQRDPVKLRTVLDNFDAYRDMMKLDKMKAALLADQEKEPEAESEAEPPAHAEHEGDGVALH
jgi:hypothetical protein